MHFYDRLTVLVGTAAITVSVGFGTCSVSGRLDGMDGWIRTHLENHPDRNQSPSGGTLNLVLDREFLESELRLFPRRSGDWEHDSWAWERGVSSPDTEPDAELEAYVEALRIVAEGGDTSAQNNLGAVYADGVGVLQDEQEAVRWFRTAADAGDASAQNNLGVMYADGRGVLRDDAAAFGWFESAAEQGNVLAQNNLGVMYVSGRGVERDYISAHKWFNLAGAAGYEGARELRDLLAEKMNPEDVQAALSAARAQRQETASSP